MAGVSLARRPLINSPKLFASVITFLTVSYVAAEVYIVNEAWTKENEYDPAHHFNIDNWCALEQDSFCALLNDSLTELQVVQVFSGDTVQWYSYDYFSGIIAKNGERVDPVTQQPIKIVRLFKLNSLSVGDVLEQVRVLEYSILHAVIRPVVNDFFGRLGRSLVSTLN